MQCDCSHRDENNNIHRCTNEAEFVSYYGRYPVFFCKLDKHKARLYTDGPLQRLNEVYNET